MKTKTFLPTAGSLAAMLLGTACCWLPLLLIALGAGTAVLGSITTALETYRPFLFTGALLLLGVAWYFSFVRTWLVRLRLRRGGLSKDCCPVDPAERTAAECCPPAGISEKIARMNRFVLPFVTVIVLGMILFPQQIFAFLAPRQKSPSVTSQLPSESSLETVILKVPGMF